MPSERFDAVVVGGGPGGASAAGFLAKLGLRAAVLEKAHFPRYHIGESLLPSTTLGILGKLGAGQKLREAGFVEKHGGTFVWGNRPEPWTFRFYRTGEADAQLAGEAEHLHSYQVERARFDELLLRHAAELGADVREGARVVAVEHEGDPKAGDTTIHYVVDDEERALVAPFVVDASGRGSPLARRVGQRHYDPFFKNVAIYRYYEGAERMPGELAGNILCVAFAQGWFWFIPLANGLTSVGVVIAKRAFDEMNGKAMAPADLFDQMVAQAPPIAERLVTAQPSQRAPYDEVRCDADYSYITDRFAHDGIFLVGDSACFIDPVFSSGVHLATYAGMLAAQGIADLAAGRLSWERVAQRYEDAYRREYTAFYRFLISFYEMHRDPESYFWAAHKVLEDVGVEPTSDDGRRREHDAFIRIVSGQATAGATLFSDGASWLEQIGRGATSLGTLVDRVTGKAVNEPDLEQAMQFMRPVHEGRHAIVTSDLTQQQLRPPPGVHTGEAVKSE